MEKKNSLNVTVIRNGRIVTPEGVVENGTVVLCEGKIVYVGTDERELNREMRRVLSAKGGRHDELRPVEFDASDAYVCPGFIDVHVHGGGGRDVMDADHAALKQMAQTHAKHGTTGFFATTMTERYDRILNAVEAVGQYWRHQHDRSMTPEDGARLLGLHLEGPYIHPDRVGAQNPEYVRSFNVKELEEIEAASEGAWRLITMAPERPGGEEAIRFLNERGVVVSIGHTDATYEQAIDYFDKGVSHVTHMYNAMSPLHHRDPGVVGAALVHRHTMTEVIADGIHIHPAAIRLVYEQKGRHNVCFITDGISAAGMPEGNYALGGQAVTVREGACRLDDGTLAGSILTMDKAIAYAVRHVDIPLHDAVRMASLNPAKQFRIADQKGSLEVGKDGDVTILNDSYEAIATWVEGVSVVELPADRLKSFQLKDGT